MALRPWGSGAQGMQGCQGQEGAQGRCEGLVEQQQAVPGGGQPLQVSQPGPEGPPPPGRRSLEGRTAFPEPQGHPLPRALGQVPPHQLPLAASVRPQRSQGLDCLTSTPSAGLASAEQVQVVLRAQVGLCERGEGVLQRVEGLLGVRVGVLVGVHEQGQAPVGPLQRGLPLPAPEPQHPVQVRQLVLGGAVQPQDGLHGAGLAAGSAVPPPLQLLFPEHRGLLGPGLLKAGQHLGAQLLLQTTFAHAGPTFHILARFLEFRGGVIPAAKGITGFTTAAFRLR
mmetsp:Transcript_28666/g.40877  ORF Transcript_28666/g.40877 Transcript_28666/m.40877 type:complete len:282 (-) Transcript_28666:350-1195(-)